MISRGCETAFHADMFSIRECLRMICAARTSLTCAPWVYLNEPPTSVFGFVGEFVQERTPRCVLYCFRKHSLAETLNIKVFCNDGSVFLNQLPGFLVARFFNAVLYEVSLPILDTILDSESSL